MARLVAILLTLAGVEVSGFCAVVTNCSEGELRAAIAQGGTVTFACSGTINVGLIAITNDVRLDGSGAAIALSGSGSQRIFEVSSNVTLELVNLSLIDGRYVGFDSPGYPVQAGWALGGAIRMSNATLIATNCTFANNAAIGGRGANDPATGTYGGEARGGAIYAIASSLLLSNCAFANNSVTGGDSGRSGYPLPPRQLSGGRSRGGAIFAESSTLRLSNCSFVSNTVVQSAVPDSFQGGAVYALSSDVLITGSVFTANRFIAPASQPVPVSEFNSQGGAIYLSWGIAAFSGCTFMSNSTAGHGGAILKSGGGTTTVSFCTFTGNTSSNGSGGGIYGDGSDSFGSSLLINHSFFTNNNSAIYGGAVYDGGQTIISNATCVGNSARSGGAFSLVSSFGSRASNHIINCTFASNTATAGDTSSDGGGGGAIYSQRNSTIIDCRFLSNIARTSGLNEGGGAIHFYSSTTNTLVNCMFVSNTVNSTIGFSSFRDGGGAILNQGASTISNCTFTSNTANLFGRPGGGGALSHVSSRTCTVVNSTFALNEVSSTNSLAGGGAVYAFGASVFQFCTIASNACAIGCKGGGLYSSTTNTKVSLSGVILAGNFAGNNPENAGNGPGLIADLGYNLSSDATPSFSETSRTNINPSLAPLAGNGGPMLTMALLPGSPAIDAFLGTNPPSTDQRGIARPQGRAPDIGAYEAAFITSIIPSNGNVWITYPSVPNHIYTLEASSVTGGSWLDSQSKTSGTTTVRFGASNSIPRQFFRIRE